MIPYLLLLLLPALLAGKGSARSQALRYSVVWVAIVILVGLRHEVGGDWNTYLLMLHRARIHAPLDTLAMGDPAYMLLNLVAARLGLGLWAVNVVCAALFAVGLLAFIGRQPSAPLALLVALPVLVLVAAFNAPRQTTAIGLIMCALALYVAGRKWSPTLLLGAAALFHWTAAVLLVFLPVLMARRMPPAWLATAAALALTAGAAIIAGMRLGLQMDEPAEGALFRAAPTVVALVATFALRHRLNLNEREKRIGAALAGVAMLSLALLPLSSMAADRMGYYAVLFQIWGLSHATCATPPGAKRRTVNVAVASMCVLLFMGWLVLSHYRHFMVPYRSYLLRPELIRIGAPPEQYRDWNL